MGLLPEGLLDIMQCPRCAGTLRERVDPPSLVCDNDRIWYPVDPGGIPVMLDEAVQPLDN